MTTATTKLLKLDKRIKAVCGGTSAGKTISILQILIDKSQTDEIGKLTSIVSESVPHLKRGAVRDFKNIMQAHRYWKDSRWNVEDSTYTFETGSRIEFFSADSGAKLRGARRDRLFLNECNNLTKDAYDQLEVRTKEEIWLDWNPTNEFWFYTDIHKNPTLEDKLDFITLTYKDNEALDAQIVESIESRKDNVQWWRVYGLGMLGEVEGKIYTGWKIIDEVPHEARLVRRGLDYGYSVDPSVIVDIYEYNGGYIINETCYQKGMSNKALSDMLSNLPEPSTLVIADSSEPKSIDEMRSYGTNIMGAVKGPGSVSQGIAWVQAQKISITKNSTRTIKAYRNFMWLKDKDGKIVANVPDDRVHEWSNSMDAVRYGFSSLKPSTNIDLDALEEEAPLYSQIGI